MPTPTHFDSAYNVGDTVYIFFDDGFAGSAQITGLNFREDFDPLAFVAATDFIYTTNKLSQDGVSYITRSEEQSFANKNTMSVYVLALP